MFTFLKVLYLKRQQVNYLKKQLQKLSMNKVDVFMSRRYYITYTKYCKKKKRIDLYLRTIRWPILLWTWTFNEIEGLYYLLTNLSDFSYERQPPIFCWYKIKDADWYIKFLYDPKSQLTIFDVLRSTWIHIRL